MRIILALAVLLVALAYAGRGGGGGECGGCCHDPSTKMLTVVKNALNSGEAGNSYPSDSIIAASDTTLVQMVNSVIRIYDARTKQAVSTFSQHECFICNISPGDGYVTFDQINRRFFLTALAFNQFGVALTIDSPANISGDKLSTVAQFGPSNFVISGDVVASVPADGCGPITNNVTGMVVLVVRGSCFFQLKAANVEAAGGIAMLVYNNQPGLTTMAPGTSDIITIPCVMTEQTTGFDILANLPSPGVSVTLNGPAPLIFETFFYIAVSKDDSPRGPEDFWAYNYSIPDAVLADYPKSSTNNDMMIVTTQDFIWADGGYKYVGNRFTAFNATDLMEGTHSQTDPNGVFALWTATATNNSFAWPAQLRTPVTSSNEPIFIVGKNDGPGESFFDSLLVSWATFDGLQTPTPVRVPLGKTYFGDGGYGRQPPPAVPSGLELGFNIVGPVVRGDSLWTAFVYNISLVHTVIELVELDISTALENGVVTLKQRTTINAGTHIDLSYPSLSVSASGHVLITFAMSGPETYASLGYTWHYANDPPNTVRYPLQTWYKGNVTYASTVSGRNRFTDYSGCVFAPDSDPVYNNGKEIAYMVGEIPWVNGLIREDGTAAQWTTGVGEIMIDNDNDGCVKGPITIPRNIECNEIEEQNYAAAHPPTYSDPASPDEEENDGDAESEKI
jgi:hypothetical protein